MMDMNHRSGTTKVFLAITVIGLVAILQLDAQGQIGPFMPPGEHVGSPVIVDGISFSDDTPKEGDGTIISATIRNNVSMDLANIALIFLVDGVEIGNISGIALDINGSKVVDQEWKAQANTHIISAVIAMDGKTLTASQFSKEIVVEPDPIGNFITPTLLLLAIFFLIGVTTIAPGMIDIIRGNGKK